MLHIIKTYAIIFTLFRGKEKIMSKELKRTYVPYKDFPQKSKQIEYTTETTMHDDNGKLLVKGWARRNYFDYDRNKVTPKNRRKEWDFYQISNGKYMVQLSFANISFGGYVSASLIDIQNGKIIANPMAIFLGGKNKYVLPKKAILPTTSNLR
jgi:Protein of unknown function (DUF2804).